MRTIDHHIAGHTGGAGGRTADVFDPNTGQVQASVALGSALRPTSTACIGTTTTSTITTEPRWAGRKTGVRRRLRR